jgi:polysaccharide biosynthesis/export protein
MLFCRKLGHRMLFSAVLGAAIAAPAMGQAPTGPQQSPAAKNSEYRPVLQLGVGDSITISVYGQSDMTTTVYVSDDGTVPVALAGPVHVAGLSPATAAQAIEKALRDGKYFKDPHVTITVVQSRSQRITVLGEVGSPGRYPIESNATIFDILAQAGGAKETSASIIYLLRAGPDGTVVRYPINLGGMKDAQKSLASQPLQGGDTILVPKADQFYIWGEVAQPAMYRIEPGMTLVQAIVRAGGITVRGSKNRVEIKRRDANGKEVIIKGKLEDVIQPDDVIRVKESIF